MSNATQAGEKLHKKRLSPSLEECSYIIQFEGDQQQPGESLTVVRVTSIEEAIHFHELLGEVCRLFVSPEYLAIHPEIAAMSERISETGLASQAPFDTETASGLMNKLPIDLKNLINSPLSLTSSKIAPPLIEKNLVHKSSESNVILSEPFTTGWIHHFNMFQATTELTFDHASGHIQGLMISEALRQAGIASAHLQGLPAEAKLVILNYNTNFFNFVERHDPIIIRAYCDYCNNEPDEDRNVSFYIQVMQWGRICADSSITTFACLHTDRQLKLNQRLEKIATRQKSNFENRINNLSLSTDA